MGAVVAVDFVFGTLMDLPADALPGGACRAAITLIEKVLDRIADDARAAADLAGAARHRPC
jgi:hypothetical protein